MMNASNDPWIQRSDPIERSGTGLDRRRFLGAAAGRFAFAASGLVLPEGLVGEAEAADNHPVRRILDRKDDQRTRRRRDRHHQRRRRPSEQRKDHHLGDLVPTHAGILVYNWRSTPVQTRGLQRDSPYHNWYVPNGWDWAEIPAQDLQRGISTREFPGDYAQLVVQIGTDRVVWFTFDWPFAPDAEILSGGWEYNGWTPVGKVLAQNSSMEFKDSISAPGIKATRINDTNKLVWLLVELT
jgi:hypothetical protein